MLVYAHRVDANDHERFRAWLDETVSSASAFGISELVLSGFVRVVTHPRVFTVPSPLNIALAAAEALRQRPNAVPIAPGPRHQEIFTHLYGAVDAKGHLVADAYLAALALEAGCEWITTDRDYSRFPGLRWSHPLS